MVGWHLRERKMAWWGRRYRGSEGESPGESGTKGEKEIEVDKYIDSKLRHRRKVKVPLGKEYVVLGHLAIVIQQGKFGLKKLTAVPVCPLMLLNPPLFR